MSDEREILLKVTVPENVPKFELSDIFVSALSWVLPYTVMEGDDPVPKVMIDRARENSEGPHEYYLQFHFEAGELVVDCDGLRDLRESAPDKFKAAYMEWVEKTDFMDHLSLPVKYLGWHRADVLRDLITKQVPKPPPKMGTLVDLMQALHEVDTRIDWVSTELELERQARFAEGGEERAEVREILAHMRAYKSCLMRMISRRCGAA